MKNDSLKFGDAQTTKAENLSTPSSVFPCVVCLKGKNVVVLVYHLFSHKGAMLTVHQVLGVWDSVNIPQKQCPSRMKDEKQRFSTAFR